MTASLHVSQADCDHALTLSQTDPDIEQPRIGFECEVTGFFAGHISSTFCSETSGGLDQASRNDAEIHTPDTDAHVSKGQISCD